MCQLCKRRLFSVTLEFKKWGRLLGGGPLSEEYGKCYRSNHDLQMIAMFHMNDTQLAG